MIWNQVYFKVKINLNAYDKNKKDVSYMTFFLFWIKGMYVVLKIVILKIIKYNEGYRGANWGVMNGKYFS